MLIFGNTLSCANIFMENNALKGKYWERSWVDILRINYCDRCKQFEIKTILKFLNEYINLVFWTRQRNDIKSHFWKVLNKSLENIEIIQGKRYAKATGWLLKESSHWLICDFSYFTQVHFETHYNFYIIKYLDLRGTSLWSANAKLHSWSQQANYFVTFL